MRMVILQVLHLGRPPLGLTLAKTSAYHLAGTNLALASLKSLMSQKSWPCRGNVSFGAVTKGEQQLFTGW